MKATCYHIRDAKGQKVLGGTLSMSSSLDMNAAAERLVAELELGVTNSGRLTFVRGGAPVAVYLSVDPSDSDRGRAVLRSHREAREREQVALRDKEEAQQAELDALLSELGTEAAIAHLRSLSTLKKAQP